MSIQYDVTTAETLIGSFAEMGGVVSGNGLFIALGTNNIRTSSGLSWTALDAAVTSTVMAFGGGTFVAMYSTKTQVSTDGVTWNEYLTPPSPAFAWSRMGYSAGKFCASTVYYTFGPDTISAKFSSSSDGGQTWSTPVTPAAFDTSTDPGFYFMTDLDGTLFAIPRTNGNGGKSTDGGLTWTAVTLPASADSIAGTLALNGYLYVVPIISYLVYRTQDGITWETIYLTGLTPYFAVDSVAASNNAILLASRYGEVFASTDGEVFHELNISPIDLTVATPYPVVASDGTDFVIVSGYSGANLVTALLTQSHLFWRDTINSVQA